MVWIVLGVAQACEAQVLEGRRGQSRPNSGACLIGLITSPSGHCRFFGMINNTSR